MPASLSVVVPLFNKKHYIQETIKSVLLQTYKPSEIIVIDDGSTDGGGLLLEAMDSSIKVVRQDNSGEGAARNNGIRLAREEWVALLDADDLWTPDHLQELSRIIDMYPETCLVATQFEEIKYGCTARVRRPAPGRIRKIDFFKESSRRMGCVCSSTAAVKKSVLDQIGGFSSSRTGADTEFWSRVALQFPVAISEAQTAFYVRGVGGIIETLELLRTEKKNIHSNRAIQSHPACKTVLEALSTQTHRVPKSSLLLYLNAWRISLMRQALVRGNQEDAASLRKQLTGPMRFSWYRVVAMSFVPPAILTPIYLSWKTIRSIPSRAK